MTRVCEQTKSAPSARVQLPRRRNKSGAGCARGTLRSQRNGGGQAFQRIINDTLPVPKARLPFVPESQDGSPNTEPSVRSAVILSHSDPERLPPWSFLPPVTPTVFVKRASNVRDLQKSSVAKASARNSTVTFCMLYGVHFGVHFACCRSAALWVSIYNGLSSKLLHTLLL